MIIYSATDVTNNYILEISENSETKEYTANLLKIVRPKSEYDSNDYLSVYKNTFYFNSYTGDSLNSIKNLLFKKFSIEF